MASHPAREPEATPAEQARATSKPPFEQFLPRYDFAVANTRRWRAQAACRQGHERRGGGSNTALRAIKIIHTLAWFSIESSMVYLLYAGFTRRSDRRAAMAAGVVAGESLVFAANGFRCPLTQLAERLGSEHASVTDIYLPGWFAHNLPAIHAPLIVLAVSCTDVTSASSDARGRRSG